MYSYTLCLLKVATWKSESDLQAKALVLRFDGHWWYTGLKLNQEAWYIFILLNFYTGLD